MENIIMIWNFIDGYKTHIICAITIVYLWSQVWTGAISAQIAVEGTLAALGASSVRHGIQKAEDAALAAPAITEAALNDPSNSQA